MDWSSTLEIHFYLNCTECLEYWVMDVGLGTLFHQGLSNHNIFVKTDLSCALLQLVKGSWFLIKQSNFCSTNLQCVPLFLCRVVSECRFSYFVVVRDYLTGSSFYLSESPISESSGVNVSRSGSIMPLAACCCWAVNFKR